MSNYGLQEIFQSAYKPNPSTETALVRVMDDLLGIIEITQFLLLTSQFSAAFDNIDHEILFKRLEATFGMAGIVL